VSKTHSELSSEGGTPVSPPSDSSSSSTHTRPNGFHLSTANITNCVSTNGASHQRAAEYLPAYELKDGNLERSGRGSIQPAVVNASQQ
jgi:hypothetical protein